MDSHYEEGSQKVWSGSGVGPRVQGVGFRVRCRVKAVGCGKERV